MQTSSYSIPDDVRQPTLLLGSGYRSSSISAFLQDDDQMHTGNLLFRVEGTDTRRLSLTEEVGNVLARFGVEGGALNDTAEAAKNVSGMKGKLSLSPSRKKRVDKKNLSSFRQPRSGASVGAAGRSVSFPRVPRKPNQSPTHTLPRKVQNQRGQKQRDRGASRAEMMPRTVPELSMFAASGTTRVGRSLSLDARSMMSFKERSATPGERKRTSFIQSIAISGDRPWQPTNVIMKKSTTVLSKKSELELKPLQRHTARRLYNYDVPAFNNNLIDTTASKTLKLSEVPMQSIMNGISFSDSRGDIHSAFVSQPKSGGRDFRWITPKEESDACDSFACRENMSNVFLPEKESQQQGQQGDVWRACSSLVVDHKAKTDWMRPLQEMESIEGGAASPVFDKPIHHHHRHLRGHRCHNSPDDDYHGIFQGFRCRRRHLDAPFTSAGGTDSAQSDETKNWSKSLAARSALLQQPQQLLESKNLTSSVSSLVPNGPNCELMTALNTDVSPISLLRPEAQHETQFVKLSHAAQVLYVSVLYMRTLGGLPTLLRICPLTVNSDVEEKEHCIELIFSSSTTTAAATISATTGDNKSDYKSGSGGSMGLLHLSNTFLSPQGESGSKARSLSTSRDAAEERVVVRSILAEKCVVKRFGKQEVVHVLPPLKETTVKAGNQDILTTSAPALRSDTANRVPKDAELPSDIHGMNLLSERFLQYQRSGDGGQQALNHGDVAVAFLMSADASKFCAVLPEPMDLETLRYKVYALQGQEPGSPARAELTGLPKRQHRGGRKSSFELQLKMMMESGPASPSSYNKAEMKTMQQRFPPYYPVTVSESTLSLADASDARFGSGWNNGECVPPVFHQLRLPRLHADLVDAVQYALEKKLRMTRENVMGSPRF